MTSKRWNQAAMVVGLALALCACATAPLPPYDDPIPEPETRTWPQDRDGCAAQPCAPWCWPGDEEPLRCRAENAS